MPSLMNMNYEDDDEVEFIYVVYWISNQLKISGVKLESDVEVKALYFGDERNEEDEQCLGKKKIKRMKVSKSEI